MPRSIPFLLNLLLHGALMINQFPSTSGGVTKIDSVLKQKIDSAPTGSTWDVIIEFNKDPTLETELDAIFSNSITMARNLKIYESMLLMEKYMNEIQGSTQDIVKKFQKSHKKMKFESFYLSGNLGILKAPKELIYQLGDDEKPENANITRIGEDEAFYLEPPRKSGKPVDRTGQGETEARQNEGLKEAWGLKQINAPAWWDADYNGTGVIIGHMDSGVDIRHPSLKWNWLGKPYGWLDPVSADNTYPFEYSPNQSHGTHTLGVIVGRGLGKGILSPNQTLKEDDVNFRGVGVAPGARWISCLYCRGENGSCLKSLQEKCGKFLHCPDPKTNCRYTPSVVSMSIGCEQNSKKPCSVGAENVIQDFVRAGVIPVVAAGNNGFDGCQTVGNPADFRTVMAVGTVDKNDNLHPTSSRGPPNHRYTPKFQEDNNIFKPDLVAPGEEIFSTVHTGRAAKFRFDYRSGTSQAAPHVAGAIALLLSRNEELTVDQIKEILYKSAVPNDKLNATDTGLKCGQAQYEDKATPNHKFGWGRLRLPDPNDKMLPAPNVPKRSLPPPPDYSGLDDNSTPPSVRSGIAGVVLMAAIAFLMKEMMEM